MTNRHPDATAPRRKPASAAKGERRSSAAARQARASGPKREAVAFANTVAVRGYLESHNAELLGMLSSEASSGLELARRHAKNMDGLLTSFYPAAAAMVRPKPCGAVLLAAVGGYGRQLLGLKSDLDIRIFTSEEEPDRIQALAEAVLYPLWDAGVSIGHQVVTISDALATAAHDLPTATALLDARPIAGDAGMARELRDRASAGLFSDGGLPHFMGRLQTEISERHKRFGDSVYLLEPDVKSGAGGLRDLDIALWACRARWNTMDLADLVRLGVLVTREADEIRHAANFLWTVRNHLHRHAGRRADRLTFGEQLAVALAMNYPRRIGAPSGVSDERIAGPIVEVFMSDYYRCARDIRRACEQLVGRATPRTGHRPPREVDLGDGLRLFDGQVSVVDASQLAAEPVLALRLYAAAVARSTRVLPFARDAVARAAAEPSFGVALRASPEAASIFVRLVCNPQKTQFRGDSILGELHDVGLLVAMVPEFAPVVGRVHHDVYHVYTVDVHSIAAVDRLRALLRGDLAEQWPLATRLAVESLWPHVLFLATLLHDIGKVVGGTDHSTRGAVMARAIFARLGFSPAEVEEGCHLILHHLLMYFVAVRRDLEDPATIAEFSEKMRGPASLCRLYLLTVADLSTTSPTAMTRWKAGMLEELWQAAHARLSGIALADAERVRGVRDEVKRIWSRRGDAAFIDEFLDTMPERYLLSNKPAEIATHAQVAREAREKPVQVALVSSRHADVVELCVVTGEHPPTSELCVVASDRPGLLAAITAAIVASKLEVHAAQINTRSLGDGRVQAVDLFWVRDRAGGAAAVKRVLPKLDQDLRTVITGGVSARELAFQRSSPWSERPSPPVRTEVSIDNGISSQHTVIEVLTKDRPGLLFTLSQAMHELGLTITVAKINTEGTRVADVFYVTEVGGTKLAPDRRLDEVRAGLLAALGAAANA
jgi:[protein-PII] uridylyltransferase